MKPYLLFFALLCLCFPASAQVEPSIEAPHTLRESVRATPIQLEVKVQEGEMVTFQDNQDFSSPKILHGYFQLRVSGSQLPWIVTASISNVNTGVGRQMISRDELIKHIFIRTAMGQTIPLSLVPQMVLAGAPSQNDQHFALDLIITPIFDSLPGTISGMVNFQLELQ